MVIIAKKTQLDVIAHLSSICSTSSSYSVGNNSIYGLVFMVSQNREASISRSSTMVSTFLVTENILFGKTTTDFTSEELVDIGLKKKRKNNYMILANSFTNRL